MVNLPSGLPEHVDDEEDIARFLTSSSQFTSIIVKPSAFLPSPNHRETSVTRHGRNPERNLWKIGKQVVAISGRTLYGAAILKAADIRSVDLDVLADEPPARHAAIRNWPWLDNDPDLQKAQQKQIANQLTQAAGPPFLIAK
jgi:hypothetical protein